MLPFPGYVSASEQHKGAKDQMPNAFRFAKVGTILLAVLVAVTGYAALHPKVVHSTPADS